jgi:hypothetical protein
MKINACYLNGSPLNQVSQLVDSKFNTIIATFIGIDAQGNGTIDGAMGDWQPSRWINPLRNAGKTLLFSIGGEAVNPSSLECLFQGPLSIELNLKTYGTFSQMIRQILKGGPITLKGAGGVDYPTDYGQGFHGVDFDLENFSSYSGGDSRSDLWADRLSQLNVQLRKDLPAGTLITHAPQTPYMLNSSQWPGANGGNPHALYSRMMQKSGDSIDWLNVQIYNQGNFSSTAMLSNMLSSLLQDWPPIADTTPNKIVITVPFATNQCGSGYINPDMLKVALASLPPSVAARGFNGWAYNANNSVSPHWDQQFTKLNN